MPGVQCCAPGCRSGHPDCPDKVTYHSFPTDETRKKLWISKVPSNDFLPKKTSRLCEKHFAATSYKSSSTDTNSSRASKKGDLSKKLLKSDAFPTIWPDPEEDQQKAPPRTSRNSTGLRVSVDADEAPVKKQGKTGWLTSLLEFDKTLDTQMLPSNVSYISKQNKRIFLFIDYTEQQPVIRYSVVVNDKLNVFVTLDGIPVKTNELPRVHVPGDMLLKNCDQLYSILSNLEEHHASTKIEQSTIDYVLKLLDRLDTSSKLEFLKEQLSLLYAKPNARRYSPNTLAMAAMWHNTSSALYKLILTDEVITLPVDRHIRRLTHAITPDLELAESSVQYLTARKKKLAPKDLKVVVLLDEVFSQMTAQYSHGKFYGLENGVPTKTILCTMLKSIAGKYRDIISMSPQSNISAEKILVVWKNLMKVLTEIGFEVRITMNDQHPSNVKFFGLLLGKSVNLALKESRLCGLYTLNPYNGQKVFLAFDTTHVFKNFYGNFQTYKHFEFPSFKDGVLHRELSTRANFNDLQVLYDMEISKPERKAYKLNQKILNPKSIEKTNAQLAVGCFHDSTINALRYYSSKGYPQFEGTADFLQVIRNWFSIFNVKSLYSGQKSRNPYQKPIYKSDDDNLKFLENFIDWLSLWEASNGKGFSKQTFQAGKVTTLSMIHFVKALLEDPLIDYILLGLVSSDYLESRFGWFRQLCGADYFNAVLQFLQAEKKIRLRCLVKDGYDFSDIKEIFKSSEVEKAEEKQIKCEGDMLLDEISEYEFQNLHLISDEDKATMKYTAGYIARSLAKGSKCEDCKIFFKAIEPDQSPEIPDEDEKPSDNSDEYLDIANRGGLTKPSDVVFMACVHAWALYVTVSENGEAFDLLMQSSNPRSVFTHCYLEKMQLPKCSGLYNSSCRSGCKFVLNLKKIAMATFNLKARNYIARKNDEISLKKREASVNHKNSAAAKKIKKSTSN